jgi:hypothetical protein
MKFLQIKHVDKPKILEMGVDFSTIHFYDGDIHLIENQDLDYSMECRERGIIQFEHYREDETLEVICLASDCYEPRPLIEVDELCEFDVIEEVKYGEAMNKYDLLIFFTGWLVMFDYFYFNHDERRTTIAVKVLDTSYKTYRSKGSIFLAENQQKYPELYQEALKIIKGLWK